MASISSIKPILSRQGAPLELWGGVECTINRVENTFFDQLHLSGHRDRAAEDFSAFADLGFRRLRTALHWERFAATGSWEEFDYRIRSMDRYGLRPVVGLLHHGSGPANTNLLDPDFPRKLAAYALQVAARYPEAIDYTPVNEPQTTARFCCLYGHWYPHHRNMQSYVRALYHQIKGIVLAMQAIRTVQPQARLIHTEDGGETFSTPQLESYRVERERRRWIGTDLLCGRLTQDHPTFAFLVQHGLTPAEILWFTENPCPPSVLGLNYYVTSDRFLDHRLSIYPRRFSGGDTGSEPLVDIEAVRIRKQGIAGARSMLRQAWARHGLPLAITEAHLGCEPAEQVRWLAEIWRDAQAARLDGADVQAVTVWSLLGCYNWSNLCTRDAGAYEPGVFDLANGTPTPTALAGLIRTLIGGLPPGHDATRPGWWRTAQRLTIPPPLEESARLATV